MFSNFKKVLVISPHTDDFEFGCSGTVKKLLNSGAQVHSIVFSDCKESLPRGLPPNILRVESVKAFKSLGCDEVNLEVKDYPVRYFHESRQDILQDLINIRNKVKPDLIFTTNSNDTHQDHAVIHMESIRAFKNSNLLGYECPWNQFKQESRYVIGLKKSHVNAKLKAISMYKSQSHRKYFDRDTIISFLKSKSVFVDAEYAEAFEIISLRD